MTVVSDRFRCIEAERPRRSWAIPVGATALAFLLIAVGFLLARPARAVSLEGIAQALANAKAVHVTILGSDGRVIIQRWYKGRLRRSEHFMGPNYKFEGGFDGVSSWQIDGGEKIVEIGLNAQGEIDKDMDLDTVETIIERFKESAMANPKIERIRIGEYEKITFEGKSKSRYEKFKVELTADPVTQLPIRQEMYRPGKDPGWKLSFTTVFEYPIDIDDAFFKLSAPTGYAVYDYAKVIRTLEASLVGNGQTQTVHGTTLTLLGAIQEEDGGVFVLWTGGAAPPLNAHAAVFDTSGKQHIADFRFENDDRSRPRNHGIPPKNPPKPVPRDKIVIKLNPMGWHKGVPFYCLHFNPARFDPNAPQTYNIALPVCEATATYIQQPPGWVKHEASGKEVGVATFRVTTMPLRYWGFVSERFDPDHMFETGSYPATNIGMTKEQVAAYKAAQGKRLMREMMEDASRRTRFIFGDK